LRALQNAINEHAPGRLADSFTEPAFTCLAGTGARDTLEDDETQAIVELAP
jgi:hypothetical protein